ncbi:MAG TPA: D-cysteine desulfhydrase family protein [Bacteroidota bacterium]|nr:D-cysteine desulfhydrase family protein [Bacteroidota bacterium]
MNYPRLPALPRFPLAFLPTPLQRLDRFSAFLGGPPILMKRDDLTGLAFGGNKSRKLEFFLGEALASGSDTVVTAGAAQSNHCRQTAAGAARAGLRCDLVLGGTPEESRDGNLLLDVLLGANLHWAGPLRRGERLDEVSASLRGEGRRPYVIPYGGSSGLGAIAFVCALFELSRQLARLKSRIQAIVFPSSSGGTQAGLVLGAAAIGLRATVLGIGVDKGEPERLPYVSEILEIAHAAAKRLKLRVSLGPKDIRLEDRYVGEGYGIVGPLERDAIRLVAQKEGILLDPVYTGRAMGGLIDLITRREFDSKGAVLFWHTGGSPALFHYARDLA